MIHLLHGTVEYWAKGAQTCRNYVSTANLEEHLSKRTSKYGDWSPDCPDGDVLTVDDATRGGADACILARQFGHSVLLFVNPWQVITGEPYFFSVLDAAMDARTEHNMLYRGETLWLKNPYHLRRFRKRAKALLMTMPASQAVAAAYDLAEKLGAKSLELPPHILPLTPAELCGLRDMGVRIESHGWSHTDIQSFDDAALIEDITRTREWLRSEIAADALLYAIPFGVSDIPLDLAPMFPHGYFLASSLRPQGKIAGRSWNRYDLTEQLNGSIQPNDSSERRNVAGKKTLTARAPDIR
jgi:peptidoglycan/xylan/chitin deacetylase (PgdA/CDA1 family)